MLHLLRHTQDLNEDKTRDCLHAQHNQLPQVPKLERSCRVFFKAGDKLHTLQIPAEEVVLDEHVTNTVLERLWNLQKQQSHTAGHAHIRQNEHRSKLLWRKARSCNNISTSEYINGVSSLFSYQQHQQNVTKIAEYIKKVHSSILGKATKEIDARQFTTRVAYLRRGGNLPIKRQLEAVGGQQPVHAQSTSRKQRRDTGCDHKLQSNKRHTLQWPPSLWGKNNLL